MADGLPASVELVDVAARDGLQTGPVVPTEVKVALLRRLAAAGVRRVEAVSFAHPAKVPQMADAEAVLDATRDLTDLVRCALVLNERGLDRALAAEADEINVVVVASNTFSQRNQGVSTAEAAAAWAAIGRRAAHEGIRAGVTLSAAFGCPYEGEVDPARVLALAEQLAEAGPCEIALADTIGAAVPTQVADLVAAVSEATGLPLRCHLHDTRNTGVANAIAALQAGAVTIDAAVGGLGGCPFAPRSTGNTATEDLVWAFERMGVDTGIDLDALVATATWLDAEVDQTVGGKLTRAGAFPRRGEQQE
jgi:hydroxymethylglutaryl-CoA lyase